MLYDEEKDYVMRIVMMVEEGAEDLFDINDYLI